MMWCNHPTRGSTWARSRACSSYTKIEVSTQVLMVASHSQNGTKVAGPRLDWPALLVPRSQARQSDGFNPTLSARPSSPLLCRLPAYTTTRYDSVPLSDSGRAFSMFPNHDHMADVAITRSTDSHDCGLIIVATVTNQCPRCNRCASNSCPALCTLKYRPGVHVNVRRCATDFPRMSHWITQSPRRCHASSHQ